MLLPLANHKQTDLHRFLPLIHKTLAALILCVAASNASAQIINIENSRIHSDTTGWTGSLGTTFTFTKNVQEIINLDATMHLQYKTAKDLYLLLGNYNLLRGNAQTFSNNMFYHLRYNRKLNDVLRWEAFTQWQQNTVTNIDLRALFGTGPRFKLHESPKLRLYAASLVMFEHERERSPEVVHDDWRGDFYASFTWQPSEPLTITSTTFYQPLVNRLNDFRVLNQLTLNVKATRHFTITTNWSYLYDAQPAAGTPRINYSVSNGFVYKFK